MAQALKLYYDFLSPPSRAVWLALKLSKAQFEACPVALRKREQLTDEFKKINRFQKLPALVDGDFHLSESVAMIRYLSDKNQLSQQIYPKDLETRARVDEYLMWQFRNVHVPCGTYFLKAWALPISGVAPKPKPEVVAKLVKDVETSLDLLERFWMNDEFLVGNKLTVADLSCASEIEQLRLCQFHVNERQFPKVAKWLERVRNASKPYNDIAYEFLVQKSKQAAKL